MSPRICSHRWMASRPEVETAPVEHVCVEPEEGHARSEHDVGIDIPLHRCACMATWPPEAAVRP